MRYRCSGGEPLGDVLIFTCFICYRQGLSGWMEPLGDVLIFTFFVTGGD